MGRLRGAAPVSSAALAIGARLRASAGPSRVNQADAARRFVHDHSLHRIDAGHARAFDTPWVLERLLERADGAREPPHLSCGPRAFALRDVLRALEIPVRLVSVISDEEADLPTHTFVEVQGEDGSWHVQDPDYDVVYGDRELGGRLSARALLFGGLERVEPRSSTAHGWAATRTAVLRDRYFEAVLYDRRPSYERSILLVNAARFELDRPLAGQAGRTARSLLAERYDSPLILVDAAGPH